MTVKFVWDDEKAKSNLAKHGVSFEEASTIWKNFPIEVFHDPDNSQDEDRYIAVGFSNTNRILLVVHCENLKGSEIRIISARKASKKETKNVFGDRE